ncbi:MAG: hypothetical protein R3C53_22550 [Pirellulaceae bacterium]
MSHNLLKQNVDLPVVTGRTQSLVVATVAAILLLPAWPLFGQSATDASRLAAIEINTTGQTPPWALWERKLLADLAPAAREFVHRYTRPDGTIIWRDEWPGMDGSDDGYESFYNLPLYYVLGGPSDIHDLSRHLWNGVTKQFTEYGQIYKEFDAHYDWMHHGESYTYFYFFGMADPTVEGDRQRARRFADMYIGKDPTAENFNPLTGHMRSPLTGSRGPHFVNIAEDWVTHRPILANYPLPYRDIPGVTNSAAWNDEAKFPLILAALNDRMMRSDVPLNLTSTSMVLNEYMLSGDAEYRQWVIDYVNAWRQRVEENNGILPDNVGPSGKIGEHMDGKWWGGYYGWQWPHGLFNQLESTVIGASNAQLASGQPEFLELPRAVLDLVEQQGREVDGQLHVPHKHGDQGWYDYGPLNPKYPVHLWFASRQDEDWQRIVRLSKPEDWTTLNYRKGKGDSENLIPWLGFITGQNDEYATQILQNTYGETLRRLEQMRQDRTTVDEQDVHHWQKLNPIVLEGLVQLTMGCPNHIYHGGLLHASVRHFDSQSKRAGLPADVAVLIDRITPVGISMQVVNLHPTESREWIIQGGAFGEHNIARVKQVLHYPYQFHTVDSPWLKVRLAPSALGRIEIELDRYHNLPSYRFPW